MKKLLSVILVLCVAFSLVGCKKTEQKQEDFFLEIKVADSVYRDFYQGEIIAETSATEMVLSPEYGEKYPQLQKVLEEINKENVSRAKEEYVSLSESAREDMKYHEYPPQYNSFRGVEIIRADKVILSYWQTNSSFMGGAHPLFASGGKNFDPETGKELKLSDVMKDTDGLYSIIAEKLVEKYEENLFYEDPKITLAEYKDEDFNWVMDYEGIKFMFTTYELAPYAAGEPDVKIYFDEAPGLFNEKYTENPPSGYLINLPLYAKLEVDIDENDNKKDIIYVTKDWSMDEDLISPIIEINGKEYKNDDIYCYDFETYYLTTGGKKYLVLCTTAENDYSTVSVAEITANSLNYVSTMSGFGFSFEAGENSLGEMVIYDYIINNPESVKLMTRFDVLGTRFGSANFRMDEKTGSFVMTDDDYNIEGGNPVTASVKIEAKKMPENKKSEIAPGTVLYPLRSDGKNYIDLKTDEGVVYRVEVDSEKYPVTVNGKLETECFSDIMYAG